MQPWYGRALRLLVTRAALSYAWIQFLVCLLLAIFLKLSAPDTATWLYTGLAAVASELVLLAKCVVQQRATDRAALRAHYDQTLNMLNPRLPCFESFVALIATKLTGAMSTD